tara:strand:+ start:36 stop:563 length:528 start_codon:yes stop_codon:yes gene_type:complete
MNKNKAITDIAKLHKLWVNYVKKYSVTESQFKYAEDFVQNLYIQLIESKSFSDTKIYDSKKQINRKYVFKTLRWLLNDDGKKRKIKTNKIIGNIIVVDPETVTPDDREVIVLKVKNSINKMPEEDKKIMKLYMYELPSIRKISKALSKGTKTIQLKIKDCKQIIKKEVYEFRQTA